MNKLIITVRLNEWMMRGANSHIPYTSDEIAECAAECREAGAAITHVHARLPDGGKTNSPELYAEIARKMKELEVKPLIACWSIPFLRAVEAFLDMGEFVEPAMVNLVLCEGGIIGGHRGTSEGLTAYFHALPPSAKVAWTVCTKKGNILPVATLAIERGGHLSPGIGDYYYPELGYPTNAALVRHIASMSKAMGREVATPDEAREILNMPQRQAVSRRAA